VNLFDSSSTVGEEALKYIARNLGEQVKHINGRRGQTFLSKSLEEAVKDAWIVIEAIPEILPLKIDIFGQLDKLVQDDCILATNSSSYNSSGMIENVEKKYRVLNTHYYIPPEKCCVELMSCGFTDPIIIEFLMEKTKTVGFRPIHVKKESTGMIFNRIWAAIKRESLSVLSEGVGSADEVDLLFKDFFQAKRGPCENMDAVGLDTVCNIEKHYLEERAYLPRDHLDWLKENYVEKGILGDKSGKGLCQN